MLKTFFQLLCIALPWPIRRRLLNSVLGFAIDPEAHVGLSVILADELVMAPKASIGHFNYVGSLDRLHLGVDALIGNFNWITGISSRSNTRYYRKKPNRRSELIMGESSSLIHRHYIDCTDRIEFGRFAALAGVRSQLVTHDVNPISCRQSCSPIRIGAYTMVGTGVIILKGVQIPDFSVVMAGAVVSHVSAEEYSMFGGNPAVRIREIPKTARIFARTEREVL
ncbi:acyltransferase [Bradyrhizobium erythrophlei]|uniref:acyltransferase n=1 Tax=Bradyrhizobium erythrophlei TaxID=1437360 RepID=UPI0015C53B79|nr:acyltransferase [Bradyrhizobium erythrophlei]